MGGTGGCFCGKLRYEYSGDPAFNAICHCLTCRKLSGSTHTTNMCVAADNFKVTTGTPKIYKWVHESGMNLEFQFCNSCGVTIAKSGDNEAFKGLVIIQAGSLDDYKGLEIAKPAAELYVKDRVSWTPELKGVGQMTEFS